VGANVRAKKPNILNHCYQENIFLRFMVESQGSKVNSTDIEAWQLKS